MADAAYDRLARDAADGTLPAPAGICTACSVPGPVFSLNPDGGPRNADLLLGIPSQGDAASYAWFMDNPWIRDKTRNQRDTFLLRVLDRFAADQGDAVMTELWTFLAVQDCEIVCLDDEIAEDYLQPPVLDNFGERSDDGLGFRMRRSFHFAGGTLYYLTFTAVTWKEVPRREYVDADGLYEIGMPFAWNEPTGLFPVDLAARQLAQEFARAKANARIWEAIKGFFEVAAALLVFVPVAGEVALGARGAAAAVRYLFVAMERALALDAMVDGSSRMIKGEGLSIGENFCEALAALADPKTAEERGKQVFMSINLLMLSPAIFGRARWLLRGLGQKTVKLDEAALDAEELLRLSQRKHGQPLALETVVETREGTVGGTAVQVRQRFSADTNKSQWIVSVEHGNADFSVITNSLRERHALQIHLIANARKAKNLNNVVGNAGEEIFAAGMVSHWGVKPENILGYNLASGGISRFGLKNRSGHGLDMLLKVPPPPQLQIRVPTAEARHHMDGLRGPSEYKTLTFSEETLLVVEVKTTLGKTKTPGFYANTQGKGGDINTRRILRNIEEHGRWWKRDSVLSVDPGAMQKVAAIRKAQATNRVEYIHAQVFLDSQGQINALAGKGIGQGSGIQINDWLGK
ncbi:hypothetical protein [Pseudomonas aeruginosa]|uniref:hypothetical protein n=1 Tax=Pseudomonas aeruginosa TaxID=287 RepID=UPI00232EC243|nr:hypothetical protein [Pseudomonas aeruginosa]